MFAVSELNRRRLRNFKANRRAYWSLWIFLAIFVFCLFAEVVANDKPILVSYNGDYYSPIWTEYDEATFGGDPDYGTDYADPALQCLIKAAGAEICFDEPERILQSLDNGETLAELGTFEEGWMLWPLVPYSYRTIDRTVDHFPSPPDAKHWLGTDGLGRDVVARIIYGFRLSVLFGFSVTIVSSIIGIIAGASQGFFGGWVDLLFQRFEEVWASMNLLYVLLIVVSVLKPTLWVMFAIFVTFGWVNLIGVVRAEFLRARNFEYVRAARALGVGDWTIMFRHLLPNAMVATVTLLPFMLTGSISLLAGLDFLDLGLGSNYPSLGELANQGKKYLQDTWLAISAFFTFAIMLSLLVFVFEGVRDAFDPRKTFR